MSIGLRIPPITGGPRLCEIAGTCDIDVPEFPNPGKMTAGDIFDIMTSQVNIISDNVSEDIIGKEGVELLNKIEEARQILKDLEDPEEMIKKWKEMILHEAEEMAMKYIEEQTKEYEVLPDIFLITPLVDLNMDNTTVAADIRLYISRPDVDTSEMRHGHVLEQFSFAVLRAKIKYNVVEPFNLNQLEEDIKSARFEVFEGLVDSVKEQLTNEFEENQQKLIIRILESQFSKYFEVFKRIQDITRVFDF